MSGETLEFQTLVNAGILEIGDGDRAKNDELGSGGPIFLRSAYLQDTGFVLCDPDRFSSSVNPRFGAKIAALDDVVITTKGNSTGRVGRIGPNEVGAVYSPHLSYWRSRDRAQIDQDFLYYWSRSAEFRHQLAGMSTSTDMAPYLSLRDQLTLRITLPPASDQRRIGRILRSLDDKIELNRRMNETLEVMAQAIFRDWFVDFGPVRRKMAGATDPVAIMGGLTPDPARAAELAALFPEALGDDDWPVGWSEKPLDQIADFLNGLALQKYPARPGEPSLPVIKIAELRGGLTEKSNRAAPDLPERYIIRDGDFLFSWSGSLMAKVWTEGVGALNQHLFKVSSDKYPQWFYARWVHHHMPEFQSIAASKATTMGHIQRGHLSSAMTACPPDNLLEAMSKVMDPLWQRAIHNDLENRTLAETRDCLLPRLMSGEVRVGDTALEIAA